MIRQTPKRRARDSTIPLINVVFLILIYFLIVGSVAPPLDKDLELVQTSDLEGREPPDALVLGADGALSFRGAPMEPEAYMALHTEGPVRIVPDRAVPGTRLMEVTGALRSLGAPTVILVTERAMK